MSGTNRAGTDSDAGLMRRAALVIALQTALAVTLVLMLVGALVYGLYVREQTRDAQRLLAETVSTVDDLRDPPAGIILVARSAAGSQESSSGTPTAVADFDVSTLPVGESRLTIGDVKYEANAVETDGRRIVGLFDRSQQESEEHRLAVVLLFAGVVGIAGAATAGWIIGLRAVRPLGRALELQRRFVADASHELRTPLTVIHTRAQLLRRHLSDVANDAQERELDQLVRDSAAMGDVISDMLLSAELQSGGTGGQPVDLGILADEVVASLFPYAAEHDVELLADVETGSNLTVNGAEASLRRACTALIDNAVGHTPPHGHIVVRVFHSDELVCVAVSDDGEGLDPTDGARLTERFARGEHAPGRGRRFGLGLALVAEVVRAHDGTLDISGSPGQGATFTMMIPALSRVDRGGPDRDRDDMDGVGSGGAPSDIGGGIGK